MADVFTLIEFVYRGGLKSWFAFQRGTAAERLSILWLIPSK
jgi:hypothetical protein